MKRQKVDHEVDLALNDPKIMRDTRILRILRDKANRLHCRPRLRRAGKNQPTLYCRYRGDGFPLREAYGNRLPRWRDLSPWLKLQLFTRVLAEGDYIQFTLKLHDDLREDLERSGKSLKTYLRDRISRRLRDRFGEDRPDFFFVIEDRDKVGNDVMPHVHGSIALKPIPIEQAPHGHRKLKELAARGSTKEAELLATRMAMRIDLRAAAGLGEHANRYSKAGKDQARNLWSRTPKFTLSNHHWVTYTMKNSQRFSNRVEENRIAKSQAIVKKATLLWDIVRLGESAVPPG